MTVSTDFSCGVMALDLSRSAHEEKIMHERQRINVELWDFSKKALLIAVRQPKVKTAYLLIPV